MHHIYKSIGFTTASVFILLSSNVQADEANALLNLKNNMASASIRAPFNIDNVNAFSTLIKGIYVLEEKGTKTFKLFINESGTLIGSGAGWQKIVSPRGDLNTNEINELKTEILRNIDTDKLIKIQYGDGGGRKLILFSAIDCPYSSKFEAALSKQKLNLNTTFYVVPASLHNEDTAKGKQNWQTAANIWCNEDNSSAWLSYWRNPKPIFGQKCELDSFQASSNSSYLLAILKSVGIKISSSPAIIREDGMRFTPPASFDRKYSYENFSNKAFSVITPDNKPLYWLRNDSNTNSNSKINFGGAINKFLFNK